MRKKVKKEEPKTGRRFILAVQPFDEDGTKQLDRFGWFNPNVDGNTVTFPSEAMVFTDMGKTHGTPEEWIDLISEDHPDWKMTYRYLEEKTRK